MGQTVLNRQSILRYFLRVVAGLLLLLAVLAVSWVTYIYSQSRLLGQRAPYLQMAATDSMTIRWGTSDKTRGEVHYGLQADKLAQVAGEQSAGHDHRIRLQGLQVATRYYYRIKNRDQDQWLQDKPDWFYTSPKVEQKLSSRILVLGDPGYASEVQAKVRDNALNWLQKNRRPERAYLDLVLTTGDNAYKNGSAEEFRKNFFTPYQSIFRNIPLWTVFGNHDARRKAFYKLFDSPARAESGGVASHDKAYFSFNYSQTHFVILDSHHGDVTPGSTMLRWLEKDLKLNKLPWTVVLFHQPPYSKGTHNSDNPKDSRGRMMRVRQNLLPILDAAKVDMVISGHSHGYERSPMLTCHYGTSDTLQEWMLETGSKAKRAKGVIYNKTSGPNQAFNGMVYMVVGSSAKVDSAPFNHPAMQYSIVETGSVIIDVSQYELVAFFINELGAVRDQFTIHKESVFKQPTFSDCQSRQRFIEAERTSRK